MKSCTISHSFLAVFVILCLSFCSITFAECPSADLTGDCVVDFEDLNSLATEWLNDCNLTNDWCSGADLNSDCLVDFADFAIMASQWKNEGIQPLVWVNISDPGVSGHQAFVGQMSKYETTNAQYCQFLNDALATGDITVDANIVHGANGSNIGADFVSQPYFDLSYNPGDYECSQIIYSGDTFSVRSRDGYDMSNHPVVAVSWYGATAFCNYYGYRLPTEWEWQAVADYDGSFTYGCGTSIDQSKANYHDQDNDIYANPLGLTEHPYTSPVNHYPSYGYGVNDMAGNVQEWTNTAAGNFRVLRGGSWYNFEYYCNASYRFYLGSPDGMYCFLGFRACR